MGFKQKICWCSAILAAVLVAGPASAGEIRGVLGGWRYNLTGTANDAGTIYDFERDLAIQSQGRRSLLLEWDTPQGWWPDISASYSQIGARGMRTDPGAPPLIPARTLSAFADYDDYDLTARYPLRWGGWTALLGLTLKRLAGDILINDSSQSQPSQQRFDEIFPLLHVQLRRPLGRVLTLTASGNGVEYQDSKALEYRVAAELRLFEPLLLEVGWQEKRYDITSGNYALDARLEGVVLRFGLLIPA